jgi:acylphosphatase
MSRTSVHYLVSGQVQGVGFRRFVLHAANRLGLTGWVCNLEDGRVECVAQGQADVISEFEMQLRTGPRYAVVSDVACTDLTEERRWTSFRVV